MAFPQSFFHHFFICNIFISLFLLIFLFVKRGLRQQLSARIQYTLWYLPLLLLTLPFFARSFSFASVFTWFTRIFPHLESQPKPDTVTQPFSNAATASVTDWINDFAVSVTPKSASPVWILVAALWIMGILLVSVFMIRSRIRLYRLERSALPLQNERIRRIFSQCCKELKLQQDIPVFCTAFLKSPITTGLLRPRIYLPMHLISDFTPEDMRYMLLHELCHAKRKDAFGNILMNLAVILYWFHPLLWYARKEMIDDRELACDSAVLALLEEEEHTSYGHTLLHFSQKVSQISVPFSSGISGSLKQMKRRILNIASFEPETRTQRIKGRCLFLSLLLVVMGLSSFFPSYAGNASSTSPHTMTSTAAPNAFLPPDASLSSGSFSSSGSSWEEKDLSGFFEGYEGCFVLYDETADSWEVYNEPLAQTRMSPYSTFKIYSALAALEYDVISPASNTLSWNGENYPFPQWNQDQTLSSALQNSVNWYFQSLDADLGLETLEKFYEKIGYGNHDLSGGITNYWGCSSLEISPLEQVKLLTEFYQNDFEFNPQNVAAVKDAMLLSASDKGTLHGKTGTGAINGQLVQGWFIGYVETSENTWFFATNIQGASNAGGSAASEITLDILKSKGIF